MTLKEMQEKREKLVADARAALEEINKNTDESRTAELEARHDKIMDELDKLDANIAREERVAVAERVQEERRAAQRPAGRDGTVRGADDVEEPTSEERAAQYRSAFARFVCGAELSTEDRALLRSFEQRIQNTGTPADGGYTVPVTLMAEIIKSMKDWGPMFDEDIARVISTSGGGTMTFPTIDDTAGTAGAHAEGGAVTDDGGADAAFGAKSLGAFSFDTEWIRWSWELDEDSIFSMESLLGSLLGERCGRKGNQQLTVGTGAGQAHGIVTASSLGKTAASATAITSDELIDLQHSVNAAYRRSPKCRWQFADDTLKAIRKLKDGQGNYLWQLGDIRVNEPDKLLSKPYSINDDVPAIATGARAIIFGDHSKYFVRKVGKVRTIVARERFAPDLGILGVMRLDGELADTAAVKHLKLA
ncbi:phage major capsid protein [Qipengyuania sp.]|uniref:phage major capsid protein n=1 Tax=Qipengyuania sp. TaxID=2004515 RepID=UPI0035C8578B